MPLIHSFLQPELMLYFLSNWKKTKHLHFTFELSYFTVKNICYRSKKVEEEKELICTYHKIKENSQATLWLSGYRLALCTPSARMSPPEVLTITSCDLIQGDVLWPLQGAEWHISSSVSLQHSISLCLYWAAYDWCRLSAAAIDSRECVPMFFTAICAFICRLALPLNGLGTSTFGGNNNSFFIILFEGASVLDYSLMTLRLSFPASFSPVNWWNCYWVGDSQYKGE